MQITPPFFLRLLGCLLLAAPAAARQETPPPGMRVLGTSTFQTPSEIQCLAFSLDSRRLAVGTSQSGILVWDLETSKEIDRIPVKGGVADLRFLSDGRRLVYMTMTSGAAVFDNVDATVVYDLRDRKELFQFPSPNHYGQFEISPDEKLLLTGERRNHRDYPGVLGWDLADGKPVPGLEEVARHQPQVQYRVASMSFTSDGGRLACVDTWSGAQNNAKYDRRPRVSVWEFKSGKLLHEWFAPDRLVGWRSGLRWLPGDTQLLASSSDETAVVNAADGAVVRKFKGLGVVGVDKSQLLCYGGGALTTYDLATGDQKDSFAVPSLQYAATPVLSRDGRWFATSPMGQMPVIIDLKERRAVAPSPDGHARQPYGVMYVADGRLLVSDGTTRIYDDETGKVLRTMKVGLYALYGNDGFTRDGRHLLARGSGGGRAELWDTVRGVLLGRLPATDGGGGLQAAYLSPDGAWGATQRERSGTLQFWDVRAGQPLGKLMGPQHSFFGRTLQLTGLAWNADGSKVFLASNNGAWFHSEKPKAPGVPDLMDYTGAFDPRAGTLLYAFEMPDEKPMAAAETVDYDAREDLVYVGSTAFCGLWKGATGKFVREIEKPGGTARFTPDGRWIVGTAAIIEVATGKTAKSYTLGKRTVVSGGGTLIAAFDEDQILRIHETRTGEELLRRDLGPCRLTGKIIGVSWHPAENRIAVTLEKQPAIVQVELPEVMTQGIEAETRRAQVKRVTELRQQNAKAEPMKVEWK